MFDNLQVTIKNASVFINVKGVTEIFALKFLQRLEKELFINERDCSWSVKCGKHLFCRISAFISTAAAGQPSLGREGCLNHPPNKSKR